MDSKITIIPDFRDLSGFENLTGLYQIFYLLGLFNIISAAMTPGIHPQSHKIKVIKIEPQPLSRTASGGHIIESKTLQKLIAKVFNKVK